MSSEANYRSLNIIQRVLSLVIALSLFTSSAPAAPRIVVDVSRESAISFYFWFSNSIFARLAQGQGIGLIKRQERQADRDARINRLQIFPGDVKISMGERVRFVALAFDQEDNPIGGIRTKWSGQGPAKGGRARISPQGDFEGTAPGSFTVMAEALGRTAQCTVVVEPGAKPNLKETPIDRREVSTRDLPSAQGQQQENIEAAVASSDTSKARAKRGTKRAHSVSRARAAKAPAPSPVAIHVRPQRRRVTTCVVASARSCRRASLQSRDHPHRRLG